MQVAGLTGSQIASCKIKLPNPSRPSSSSTITPLQHLREPLRVQSPKQDAAITLSSASSSPSSSLHSPRAHSNLTKREMPNPYFVPFSKPHNEPQTEGKGLRNTFYPLCFRLSPAKTQKAQEPLAKKTCKLELVRLSSEKSAESISSHQQEMLSELPTMVASQPSKQLTWTLNFNRRG